MATGSPKKNGAVITAEDWDNTVASEILLACFDPHGQLLWAQSHGTSGHDYPAYLVLKGGEAGGHIAGAWDSQPFFAPFDIAGNLGPSKVFNTQGAISSLSPLQNNEYYVSGLYNGQPDKGWRKLPFATNYEGFLLKLSTCMAGATTPPEPALSADCREIRISSPSGNYLINWYKGSLLINNQSGKTLQINADGKYKASFANGCGITYSQEIEINRQAYLPDKPGQALSVYNVITPNGDGDNDVLVLPEPLSGSAIRVYNRWGKVVYWNPSYQNNWGGDTLPIGTYYYILLHECFGRISSPLTILR